MVAAAGRALSDWMPAFAGMTMLALLAGCATAPRVIVHPVELMLPARPPLPHIAADELRCLSDDAYSRLVERERAIKTDDAKLRAIIRANNRAAIDWQQFSKDAAKAAADAAAKTDAEVPYGHR